MPFIGDVAAFCEVKFGRSGLETTHDCIPLVTQPTVVDPFIPTVSGFAKKTIPGLPYCTLH